MLHKQNFPGFWNQDSLTWGKTRVLSCTKNIPSTNEFTPDASPVIQTRTTTVGLTQWQNVGKAANDSRQQKKNQIF